MKHQLRRFLISSLLSFTLSIPISLTAQAKIATTPSFAPTATINKQLDESQLVLERNAADTPINTKEAEEIASNDKLYKDYKPLPPITEKLTALNQVFSSFTHLDNINFVILDGRVAKSEADIAKAYPTLVFHAIDTTHTDLISTNNPDISFIAAIDFTMVHKKEASKLFTVSSICYRYDRKTKTIGLVDLSKVQKYKSGDDLINVPYTKLSKESRAYQIALFMWNQNHPSMPF